VALTTPTRLYQLVGGPTFEHAFSDHEHFKELMPSSTFRRSILQFYAPSSQGLPTSCAWLLGTPLATWQFAIGHSLTLHECTRRRL